MDQDLLEYIKFLSELKEAHFFKNYWIFAWLFFGFKILLIVVVGGFCVIYFNTLKEKQRIIELTENVKGNKKNELIFSYKKIRKKLFYSTIIVSLMAVTMYLSNSIMNERLEKEINFIANANKTILNNKYYKVVVALNEKNIKDYKTNLFFVLNKSDEYKNLINHLNKQYYLNALTKEEYEVINMIEKIN